MHKKKKGVWGGVNILDKQTKKKTCCKIRRKEQFARGK